MNESNEKDEDDHTGVTAVLRTAAQLVDMTLNGEMVRYDLHKKVGFILTIFPYDDLENTKHVSSVSPDEALVVLRSTIKYVENNIKEEGD